MMKYRIKQSRKKITGLNYYKFVCLFLYILRKGIVHVYSVFHFIVHLSKCQYFGYLSLVRMTAHILFGILWNSCWYHLTKIWPHSFTKACSRSLRLCLLTFITPTPKSLHYFLRDWDVDFVVTIQDNAYFGKMSIVSRCFSCEVGRYHLRKQSWRQIQEGLLKVAQSNWWCLNVRLCYGILK